ncbi:hypothetical protein U0035_20125 [Niabella yanshanensis]|uniref:Lipoprotein n=1 Tax=Niabella yanshanensis TaxID=577386 RepID=A0ABZ0W636_9BACT|nr:hypothetical protein [Niabella yanshanensis]WQD37977.1 hypothetical protein U0035_20125 [Niabella yanshanensis]
MKRLFFAIAILPGLLIACNTVVFEEPQPATNDILKEIPNDLTGRYWDYDNEKELFITPGLIFAVRLTEDTVMVSQLHTGAALKGDTLCEANRKYKITRITDSSFTGYRYIDTVFNLADPHQLLKAEGDDYYLNYKMEDNMWWVTRLSFRDNVINLANIETANEVKIMEHITHVQQDSGKALPVKPDKEQFKKFVSQHGFTKGNTYLKTDSSVNNKL